ncbi:hypothetical protein [Streptomyces kanamyceticus]|uniref:hypothetical protein n=1 Tax=Streptomyces kanamyceticus TaxID=1967 RepID=UPI000A5E744F|nr:hypothetical protein [Streptomyces kanamyceticus]
MKVRITITVDVDADAWALDYGLERSEVRGDVKDYIGHLVAGSHHVDEETFIDVRWR